MVKKANKRPGKPHVKFVPTEGSQYYFFYSTSSAFSNFHPSPFADGEGNHFFCSEQYMMYHKAILFQDHEIAEMILSEQSIPLNCKMLGRRVRGFDDQIWKANARRIVEEGVYLKFSQNESIKRLLLSTNNMELIEAAARDRLWGIGFCEAEALKVPRKMWGQNWLGLVLMNVRERIREDLVGQESTNVDDIKALQE